jgi:hypothetical protein
MVTFDGIGKIGAEERAEVLNKVENVLKDS